MALSIKNRETEAIARNLARLKRKPITQAVHEALVRETEIEKKLAAHRPDNNDVWIRIQDLQRRLAELPRLHNDNSDDWLYDNSGLPK